MNHEYSKYANQLIDDSQPGGALWREMNRLASRDNWPVDGSDFVRSLHP